MPETGGFPRAYAIEVRWRDLDAMGHVNNAVFFTYLEEARVRWVRDFFAACPDLPRPGFIVASARLDYERPVLLHDTVEVRMRVLWLGTSSFAIGYEVFSRAQSAVVARAETVQCTYDYGAQRPVPIPPEMRAAIARFEGREVPPRPRAAG